MYQVKITDHKIVNVAAEKYEYPLHRPAKKYTAQVRAKKEVCIRNEIWSDWSEPVIIHDDNIITWLAADETHHQVECICTFSLTTLTRMVLLAIRVARHCIWNSRSVLRKTGKTKQISMQMEMHSEVVLGILEENGDNIHQKGHLKDFELEDL
ncbi:hypothetical protein Anapl_15853 [Anas platyrhynchos]|uniref:Uncharacterized protein n=1 Tax=Anas platyrhynchos TaxID=8839 RepID=R0M687_ANAPL|nr:hypothetical protein Anapl_15853 [Anas platyrhynchos]